MDQTRTSRKRSASAMSMSDSHGPNVMHLPGVSINPLSHTPSVLHQLRIAGLDETDQPPSKTQHKFPHQSWQDPAATIRRRGVAALTKPLDSDSDEELEENLDGDSRRRSRKKDGEKKPKYASERAPFRPLVRSIYEFLDNGDTSKAKRAFAILLRSHVHGKQVDIRRNNYWALGAEILMREGGGGSGADGRERGAYPAENIPRVREYFQDLIQRYPYNFKFRRAVSAIDFWPAQLSYEVFQIHNQQASSLRRLEHEAEDWEDEPWQESSLGGGNDSLLMDDNQLMADAPVWQTDSRDRRLRQGRDLVRQRTLGTLRELATRMDELLEDRPFSTNRELLRLRGMVSLYIGDLLIPAHAETNGQMVEARVRREKERNNARSSFRKMMEHGGRPDTFVQELLASSEDDNEPVLPVFSSLPIREYQAED
ncbi:hypothetical protein CSOJ01_00111 [Colletotrichum sojae]|uniref:Uncharacterized protein n=1 Tax=Colletotrichum sojae TaxID=2175907 RepID=A0A8H6JYW7_9PEZI|nr:hypothetical protein CSOJ01_00111 [Colletotrichum sojae]